MREVGDRLFVREWLALFAGIGLFVSLVIIAAGSCVRAPRSQLIATDSQLQIQIKGAVKREGIYECPPGTLVEDLIVKAGLLACANRKAIAFKKILLSSQTLEVPEKCTN